MIEGGLVMAVILVIDMMEVGVEVEEVGETTIVELAEMGDGHQEMDMEGMMQGEVTHYHEVGQEVIQIVLLYAISIFLL